ncbi:sensor histidine kinase [Bacteroides reticulotermitis]|uniref:sensor histidine kinase n=1 Tax=Bacteroides reticulotermitis TaxID=1133319 RepID=UPI003A8A5766
MKGKSLLSKTMTQFIICTVIILLLATPLFYLLTKYYYAEDMIDIIEATQQGHPLPQLDLEEDIMHGVMIQFALISGVLGIAIVFTMHFIARRLWKPFDETLKRVEEFRLESGVVLQFPDSDIKEFNRLNQAVSLLMENSMKSYRTQKEFTENASHELQTPLAVFQSKLDLLLQQPDMTEQQALVIQDLYKVSGRLSRLNKNLLLLAKIDNKQYPQSDTLDIVAVLNELLPFWESLTGEITISASFREPIFVTNGTRILFESMVNNLVVNAVRHNQPNGIIQLEVGDQRLIVSNTSDEAALDAKLIFNRFYRPSEKVKGNGLGLAIVKAICDYHGWTITYQYTNELHVFTIDFAPSRSITRSRP